MYYNPRRHRQPGSDDFECCFAQIHINYKQLGNQLDFVGFVSESGNFPDLGEGYFLVAEGEGIRIFQGQRHGLRPFCPIFRLSLDPKRILEQAKAESGVSEEESKGFLNSYLPHLLK